MAKSKFSFLANKFCNFVLNHSLNTKIERIYLDFFFFFIIRCTYFKQIRFYNVLLADGRSEKSRSTENRVRNMYAPVPVLLIHRCT